MFRQSSVRPSGSIYFVSWTERFIDRPASESDQRRAKEIAQAVLDGRTTVLEAVRALVSLAHTDPVADVEDRKFIIRIQSETDHLSVGEVRKLWASFALKDKDVEIARAEELYRADFLENMPKALVIGNDQIHCGNVASTYYIVTPMKLISILDAWPLIMYKD
jgi:hypothetical protein